MNQVPPSPGSVFSADELHLALLRSIPDGLCFADVDGRIRFWNEAAESITGFSIPEAVCARCAEDVFRLSDPATGHPVLPQDDSESKSYFLLHKNGHHLPVEVRSIRVHTDTGERLGALSLFSVKERAITRIETRVAGGTQSEGGFDSLAVRLDVDAPSDDARPVGLLLIQIDDFESTAKRLGPAASAKLVELLSRTTGHCLKDGDPFHSQPAGAVVAVVHDATWPALRALAERIRSLIDSARFQWWGTTVRITVSIGIALAVEGDTMAGVLARAEQCMLAGRKAGGNQVVG